ncbi:MAG: PDZ domain-containing protein [Planctomycetes bacterium]|nr:PDZ domain-containing protein [Planctomycetota bacterium]
MSLSQTKTSYVILAFMALFSIAGLVIVNYLGAVENHNKKIWLGIEVIEVNSAIQQRYGIHLSGGQLVSRVFKGSPAEMAGIKTGDVIRRWNGVSITNQSQFEKMIWKSQVNELVTLGGRRQGVLKVFKIRLANRPGTF